MSERLPYILMLAMGILLAIVVIMNRLTPDFETLSKPRPIPKEVRQARLNKGALPVPGRKPNNLSLGHEIMRGQVQDFSGSPVEGALVVLDQRILEPQRLLTALHSKPRWHTQTNVHGFFEFNTLPEGDFTLFTCKGTQHAAAIVKTTVGGPVCEQELRLVHSRSISGTVLDADGVPVSNVQVIPLRSRGQELSPYTLLPAKTNSMGRFIFEYLPEETVRFWVQHQKKYYALTEVPAGVNTCTIRLAPGKVVAGLLVNQTSDDPVRKIRLKAIEARFGLTQQIMNTDAAGRFSFTSLWPAAYRICLETDRFVTEDTAGYPLNFEESGTQKEIEIPVVASGVVRGRILDSEKNLGIEQALVTFRPVDQEDKTTTVSTTRHGSYKAVLPPGEYAIQVQLPEGFYTDAADPGTVAVAAGKTIQAGVIHGHQGVAVCGAVRTPLGFAASHVNVVLTSTEHENRRLRTRTDRNGAFCLAGVVPGDKVNLQARFFDQRSETVGPLEVGANGLEDVLLTLEPVLPSVSQ